MSAENLKQLTNLNSDLNLVRRSYDEILAREPEINRALTTASELATAKLHEVSPEAPMEGVK